MLLEAAARHDSALEQWRICFTWHADHAWQIEIVGDQLWHAGEHAAAQPIDGDVVKKPHDHVQPRRRCWRGREATPKPDLFA